MAGVVEALKQTPKGQLPYTCSLDASCSPSEQREFLEKVTSPPDILFDVVQHLLRPRPLSVSPSLSSSPPEEEHAESAFPITPPLSPPMLMDSDLLLDDERNELERSIALRREYFERERAEIYRRHEIATSEILQKTELLKHEASIQRLQEDCDIMEEVKKEMEEYEVTYRQHSETRMKQIQDNKEEMRQRLMIIEQEKMKKMEMLDKMEREAVALREKANQLVATCQFHHLLDSSLVQKFSEAIEGVLQVIGEQKASQDPDHHMLNRLKASLSSALPLMAVLKDGVDHANRTGKELQERQKQEEEKRKAQEEQQKQQLKAEQAAAAAAATKTQQPVTTSSSVDSSAAGTAKDPVVSEKALIIPPTVFERYSELEEKLQKANEASATFSKDPQQKKYRFYLQFAVNKIGIACNQSGSQILERVREINRLLSGGDIEVKGKRVSINEHPLARSYCINLLAKKIVDQGEEGSLFIFTFAAIVVLIWSDFPEFGELFLAYCYHTCPVLVPMYFNKTSGMSDTKHQQLNGYKVDNGVLEDEQHFTSRMSGCIKLYAAVLQTPARFKPHPHGLGNGWSLMARILNLEPHPGITATAILSILQVSGHALMKQYGRQFKKLMFFLYNEYMKKIKDVTPANNQQALIELELFLEKCIKGGTVPVPKDVLSKDFWTQKNVGIVDATHFNI